MSDTQMDFDREKAIQKLGINFSCGLDWWNAEYEEPTTETLVSLGVYKQVAWERDIAIQQLHELGYELGQKIEPTTNNLGVDWDELKRKILMEVDGGTDDKWLRYADVCDRISNSIDEYVQNIKALPPVTPQEPKTGHWMVEKSRSYLMRNGCCSNCKDFYTNDWKEMNYCPNCGARMEEVEE